MNFTEFYFASKIIGFWVIIGILVLILFIIVAKGIINYVIKKIKEKKKHKKDKTK